MKDKMTTYILLLRGVTPTGKNKVPMAKLREVLKAHGFENVRTYIASGNALVDTKLSAKEIENQAYNLIKKYIGPSLTVVARTAKELQMVLDENPFQEGYDISRVFFVSFATNPDKQKIQKVLQEDLRENEVRFGKHAGYMYIPGDASRSKLSNNYLEKKLGISATTRNFNTIRKLIEMGSN